MSIVLVSKILHRTGNLVDLPQLDESELGWATDSKRLFIGKATPAENIEVLTSYSSIAFSQLAGAVGNLNINANTLYNGEVLAYDGNNWINKGGNAGGLLTLGSVSNVKITGGAIGYALQTDGTGNLSWSPTSSIIANIQSITQANPPVVTTTQNNLFTDGIPVTITNVPGMTQVNGNSYYANVITSNTFSLYQDAGLTTPVNATGYSAFSYTSVSATSASLNVLTVGNTTPFSVNSPIIFTGNIAANTGGSPTNITANVQYYIKSIVNSTSLTISNSVYANGVAGNTLPLGNVTSLSATMYVPGGRALSTITGGSGISGPAAGSNTSVQYNNNNILGASASFTYDFANSILTVGGNINSSNVAASNNISASRFISNVATGTPPFSVVSTTQVANLSVANSGYANSANTANVATLANSATVAGTVTSSNQPNITSVGTIGNLTVSGNANVGTVIATQINSNTNVTTLQLISNVANGTPPLVVTSQTIVTNLNAALLNGYTTSTNASSNTIALRDSNGSLTANNISATLTVAAQPNITSVGTLTSLNASGNITGPNIIANTGAFYGAATGLTSIPGANVTGTVPNANNSSYATTVTGGTQSNITSVGTLTSLNVSGGASTGSLTVTGNSSLNSLSVSGNITATTLTISSGNLLISTGNLTVSSGVISGNGSGLNSMTGANVTGQVSNALVSGTVYNNTQPNITSVGSLTSLTVSGNTTIVGNAGINNSLNVAGTLTVNNNANLNNNLSVAGNASANIVNISVATGTSPLTVNSTTRVANLNVANAGYSDTSGYATTAGTVIASNQPNITAVGSGLTIGGVLALTAGNFSQSLTSNGYSILPNGLIIQWASVAGTVGSVQTYSFPLAFPNGCLFCNGTYKDAYTNNGGSILDVSSISKTQFRTQWIDVYNSGGNGDPCTVKMFAIGY